MKMSAEFDESEPPHVRKAKVGKFLLKRGDKFGTDQVLGIVFLVFIAFFHAGVAADGRDVNHSVPVPTKSPD